VLQEKQFERVGGTRTLDADVRIIAATHRDLEKMVQHGSFREDLWYRLNVLPIRIPPLRLRREDIPSLVNYFIQRKSHEMNLQRTPAVSSSTIERLTAYDWPGNVRELQNVIERALILSRGTELQLPELCLPDGAPAATRASAVTPSRIRTMNEAIADHIRFTLERTHGQVAGPGGAAEILQINPSTLRFRMKKLGITLSAPKRGVTQQ